MEADATGVAPVECRPTDVRFSIVWDEDVTQAMRGVVTATNVSDHDWRITGKPGLLLVDLDGRELDHHVVTLEARIPGWVATAPGESVSAPIGVSSWDASELAEHLLITWPAGRAALPVTWPSSVRPNARGETMTTSSWFVRPNQM